MHPTTGADLPSLPSLDPGVHLLETDSRATGALHSLVLDRLLLADEPVVWVDAHGYGSSTTLAQIAPSMRILEDVRIARGFTPFQHCTLVEDTKPELDDGASMLVLPEYDWIYRSDDIQRGEATDLLDFGTDIIDQYADRYSVPVLVSRYQQDELTKPIKACATTNITCELTDLGPRFVSEEFETLVYPGNGYVQTTLSYWRHVLVQRHQNHPVIKSEVSTSGAY